ncbi:hypothetical protein IGI04_034989 [Brassica rapa subsp. trilocularis]|uniref:Uncharacterized protein n=1 Tax=Brassica rapa subsp. trilocularis TaxID=1813537 RepID=A0ABQ7LD78_BRACM|nr:hypothetical protein IGI04_034989 [Brassica rapa subsp. trilocularis]
MSCFHSFLFSMLSFPTNNIHTSLGEVISKRTTSLCWTGASHPATFESLVVSLGYSATLSVTLRTIICSLRTLGGTLLCDYQQKLSETRVWETMDSEEERNRPGNSYAGLSNLQMRALNDSMSNLLNTGLEAIHQRLDELQGRPTQSRTRTRRDHPRRNSRSDLEIREDPTEVQPFSRTRSTDRAVYRIDPRAPGRDLRMDPRPDDRISQTTGILPRPIRHSRANSQARTQDHREESDSGLILSFLARLGRTARPDQADHDLSNHFDDFMMIDASNYSKGRILKLSEDLGRVISSSVHGSSTINHAGSLTSVLLLTAVDLITTE